MAYKALPERGIGDILPIGIGSNEHLALVASLGWIPQPAKRPNGKTWTELRKQIEQNAVGGFA